MVRYIAFRKRDKQREKRQFFCVCACVCAPLGPLLRNQLKRYKNFRSASVKKGNA